MSEDKAKAIILFVLNQAPDGIGKHELFKILYFANQKHLMKYGDAFINDFVAMRYGPVPSFLCHILNTENDITSVIEFDQETHYILRTSKSPDMGELSKTEAGCILESIAENKGLSFDDLTRKSHDAAWEKSWNARTGKRGEKIDIVEIAKAAGANEDMLEYISDELELDKILQ
jgi:uncharacterized phage-associated protein